MLSITHLKTFLTVTKAGSFTRAGNELGLTQPAVSGHIAALEEELGVKLFNRTGRKIVLTDAGALCRQAAKDINARLDELQSDLADLQALKGGMIRIGASKIIGVYMLPKILMAFRDQFPDIELQISIHSAHTIAAQVEDNAYDLAIVGEGDAINPKNIGTKVIGEDEFIIIAPPDHPFAARGTITTEDIAKEPFILSGALTASLQSVRRQLRSHALRLKSTIEMDEAGAIKRAVEEGAGLAIVSKAVVERELADRRLVALRLEGCHFKRSILMLWRQDRRFSKNTEAFMKFLQKAFEA